MSTIIKFDMAAHPATGIQSSDINHSCESHKVIDISALRSGRRLPSDLIAPATEDTSYEVVTEHTSDPIRSLDDIMRISQYLIDSKRWRDNMLFIVGINFGLRVSDLRTLRFSHLIDDNFMFRDSFPIYEQKTRNTRKVHKNRYITINDAVIEAVTLYLENTPNVKLSDYMFRSISNNGCYKNEPMHRNSIDRMLKGINEDLDLGIHMSTHTLRKTFGMHQMIMSNNDPRKLLLLSKIFGHSSTTVTMDYIGITFDEIEDAYRNLNLGSKKNYLDSRICETEQLVG